MSIIDRIKKYGVVGSSKRVLGIVARGARSGYYQWKFRNAQEYHSPTPQELDQIEQDFLQLGVTIHDYAPLVDSFAAFKAAHYFPIDYHGGLTGSVWDEKLLEHWIAAELLGLMNYQPADIYLDVAAGNSPWAKVLREYLEISAFAIDLEVGVSYKSLPFYKSENATATTFEDASVNGASLQCAYEMFMGNDDANLLKEMARILKPGGKVVILPLYMHTHYCAYSTPEYFGKGYSDLRAREYVRFDCFGVPSSRKYDVKTLKTRVLGPIEYSGMSYRVLALRNKADLGRNIYCHFILEVTK